MYMADARRPNATYIPLKMGFALATRRKWNIHKKKEMYMANARNWRHLTQKIPTCWYFLRQLTQNYYFLRYLTQKYPTPDILRSGGI